MNGKNVYPRTCDSETVEIYLIFFIIRVLIEVHEPTFQP